jgi:cytochrome c oxidase accessory protein FixG
MSKSAERTPRSIPAKLLDESMYVSEAKIYPREISGRFQRLRVRAAWILMGLFYLSPWVNLAGEQALLFDLPKRQFHVLGLHFWPQDFIFLAAILLTLAVSLFFFTAIAGRLWCGYACPQTVWTEVFLALERIAEGNRAQRIKLDQAPWSWHKWRRKGLKQLMWLSFALWTGITFVGFFSPIRSLVPDLLQLRASGWEVFWVGFYGLATYGNAGYLREQVCKYMCPYARFQGAMFDADTLIISYDQKRGEARGPGKQRAALGDCIDCTLCVQVCPTGIDIRDGLQIDCIACGACIDACDQVMEKVGSPLGLIRYSTENAMAEAGPQAIQWRKVLLRPRVILYALLLSTLFAATATGLVLRKPLLLDVLRDRNALYRVLNAGEIENSYSLKITNKASVARNFVLELRGPAELALVSAVQIAVPARSTVTHPVTVHAYPLQSADASQTRAASLTAVPRRIAITFALRASDDARVSRVIESAFFTPIGESQ